MIDKSLNDKVVTIREHAFKKDDVILKRYRVLRELGRGGMGIVYLCRDLVANVEVAVKGLPPEVSHSSEEMDDILRNYQLVRSLRDENIAAVTNLELDQSSKDYFLVMDYAEGTSLKKWMMEHPGLACWRKKVAILRQVAKALDYAHRAVPRHIIHRDVKPSNIIVDDMNAVKVLDFGLAAQIRSSLSRVSLEVTSRSGTPSYKSPEQWMAQPQREASDQYSLGVIAYQMMADVLPFDNENSAIMREAVVNDPVPEVPELPRCVNCVLAKVLSKRAADRYGSCGEFVKALESALERGDEDLADALPPKHDTPDVLDRSRDSLSSEPTPQKMESAVLSRPASSELEPSQQISQDPALSQPPAATSHQCTQAFALPESLSSSTSGDGSEMDVVLPDVPRSRLLENPLSEQEIREIRQLCKGYRTLLAESALIHQKRQDDREANLLRRLQVLVRDATPADDGTGNADDLIRIFSLVGCEYGKFLTKRADYAYFMEHRRRALLFQKNRVGLNAVTKAMFGSIE